MRRPSIAFFLFAVCGQFPVRGASVFVIWSPERAALAADSKASGDAGAGSICKLVEDGEVFAAFAGLSKMPPHFDALADMASAIKAKKPAGFEAIFEHFGKLAQSHVRNAKPLSFRPDEFLDGVLVGTDRGRLRVLRVKYAIAGDGTMRETTRRVADTSEPSLAKAGAMRLFSIGSDLGWRQYQQAHRSISFGSASELAAIAREVVARQIAADGRENGLPISVVGMERGTHVWVDKGVCRAGMK